MLARERGNLRVDGRYFNGDDLDVREAQRVEVALQSVLGLVLAEQRLAEDVHVHAQAGLAAAVEVLGDGRVFSR